MFQEVIDHLSEEKNTEGVAKVDVILFGSINPHLE